MFSRPRMFLTQLILFLTLALTACVSFFAPQGTPTPFVPTSTPVPPTPTPPPLAAIVNGEYITQAEFEAELERFHAAQRALGRTVSDQEAEKTVLDDLVARVLLAQGAREGGFDLTESALQSRVQDLADEIGGDAALSEWISEHGYTEESFHLALKRSVEAAWMRDKIVADVPLTAEQVHIQQILSYNEEDALQVLELLKGGADFDELAGSPFYDPTTRGELGWVPRGYLLDENIEAAAFSLEVGEFSDVIATPAGFHIIKVLERDPQYPLSPDALLSLQEKALQDWLEQKREQSDVDLDP
jgi:peptidyl-prolyl cis-trans isomerase C